MNIQRLNMDNSWLLQFNQFKILVDPWLEGEEIDYFPWFNTQWHRTQPIAYDALPAYDVVLITQKYPDHFHQQTLLKLQPKKIIAPKSIEANLKKLLPQAEIISFGKQLTSIEIEDVKIEWYATSRKIDPIYDAFLISSKDEAIFLATHGYFFTNKNIELKTPIKLLISPFNSFKLPFYLGGTVSPGKEGLNHLNQALNPNFIISTHDEDKYAKGLVIKMAKVQRYTKAHFESDNTLKNKIIELNHYNPITL